MTYFDPVIIPIGILNIEILQLNYLNICIFVLKYMSPVCVTDGKNDIDTVKVHKHMYLHTFLLLQH